MASCTFFSSLKQAVGLWFYLQRLPLIKITSWTMLSWPQDVFSSNKQSTKSRLRISAFTIHQSQSPRNKFWWPRFSTQKTRDTHCHNLRGRGLIEIKRSIPTHQSIQVALPLLPGNPRPVQTCVVESLQCSNLPPCSSKLTCLRVWKSQSRWDLARPGCRRAAEWWAETWMD